MGSINYFKLLVIIILVATISSGAVAADEQIEELRYQNEYKSVTVRSSRPFKLVTGKLYNELLMQDSFNLPMQVTSGVYDVTIVRHEDERISKSGILMYEVSSCNPDNSYSWSMLFKCE